MMRLFLLHLRTKNIKNAMELPENALSNLIPIATNTKNDEVPPVETRQAQTIIFIIDLIRECNERGCYSLDLACEIKNVINRFGNSELTVENRKKDIAFLFDCINLAQRKGKLSLKESYLSYVAISNFINPDITEDS